MRAALTRVWHTGREYLTHWMVAGLVVAATGVAPDHWMAHLVHALHIPADALHLWAAGIDLRWVLLAAGLLLVVGDIVWRRWNERANRGAGAATPAALPAAVPVAAAPALPDKPSIAVLPFVNMSGDSEQEYFSDGMAEEITTALSRMRWLFVIARNSAFAYKGQSPDMRDVGRALGVRYVLEGSVRKSGDTVRITGQLVDATTGAHLWADRFDGSLQDIFALQDRVSEQVVGTIAPTVQAAEIARAQRKPTGSLQAYDLYLRALALATPRDLDGSLAAIELLRQAVTLDPHYALAFALKARTHYSLISQGLGAADGSSGTEAVRAARAALALDRDDPEVLALVSTSIGLQGGELETAIAYLEKAVALNPNSFIAHQVLGLMRGYVGPTERALSHLDRALRLDPLGTHRGLIYMAYGITHFSAGDYAATVEASDNALRTGLVFAPVLRYRAAALGLLGRIEEGREAIRRLLEIAPGYTIHRAYEHLTVDLHNPFRDLRKIEALCEGLRRSGLPE